MSRKWNGTHFCVDNLVRDGGKFRDTEGNKLPDGEHPTIHWNRLKDADKVIGNVLNIFYCFRFLQQWVMAWNDWPGNIWITTANTLPNFHPPRILIAKQTDDQKNWYPNIIHKFMGKSSPGGLTDAILHLLNWT